MVNNIIVLSSVLTNIFGIPTLSLILFVLKDCTFSFFMMKLRMSHFDPRYVWQIY